ncbi:MAG: NAD(+) synthase, partial [Clostridia bacterium]
MRDGFIKIAAATVDIRVADVEYNVGNIIAETKRLSAEGVKVIAFPELCLCGYTCSDLFLQQTLLKACADGVLKIAAETADLDCLIAVGLPFAADGRLYNCAAVMCRGEILGLVPKRHIPNYGEFYELRHFTPAPDENFAVEIGGRIVPFGTRQLFRCDTMPELIVGVEICEDLWVPDPPSTFLATHGATLILNLSASDELVGKNAYRRSLVSATSARLVCAYAYADAGYGESTTDMVFCGQNIIGENGVILSENTSLTENKAITACVDLVKIVSERRRMNSFTIKNDGAKYSSFSLNVDAAPLDRYVDPMPFVPSNKAELDKRCEEILTIQALGLKKRLDHTGCKNVVIGLSGGLDSTLAYLVAVKAFDMLGLNRKGILAVTMPCFGTTARTHNNALTLSRALKTDFAEVNIEEAVRLHFRDIGHSEDKRDVTYENCQARERTQVLMDLANKSGGLVIGTGDLSELAMGWATYNGDHMSMYGVNASIPKTLVRHLVAYAARQSGDELRACLEDILATPVSPELLPPKDGVISQQTEDIIGPYELHDFFLYYLLRLGFSPKKIFRLAEKAFEGSYDGGVIKKWMETFYRRFFAAQFKRSCLPDGPKVGSVAVSP